MAKQFYSPLNENEVITINESKQEIISVLPALWQKVCEWASYAFSLIASGCGLFEKRPMMPSLKLNRVKYIMTATKSVANPESASCPELEWKKSLRTIGTKIFGIQDRLVIRKFAKADHQAAKQYLEQPYKIDFKAVVIGSGVDDNNIILNRQDLQEFTVNLTKLGKVSGRRIDLKKAMDDAKLNPRIPDVQAVTETFYEDTLIGQPRGWVGDLTLVTALWEKVCEWASYAFCLITSGFGYLEERPSMPTMGLSCKVCHLTGMVEGHSRLSHDRLVSSIAKKIFKNDERQLQKNFTEEAKRAFANIPPQRSSLVTASVLQSDLQLKDDNRIPDISRQHLRAFTIRTEDTGRNPVVIDLKAVINRVSKHSV